MAAAFKAGNSEKARGIGYAEEVAPTLAAAPSGTNQVPSVAYSIQGNVVDRAAQQNGCGVSKNIAHTLNAIDRHAVSFQTYQKVTGPLMANSHPGIRATNATDVGFFNSYENISPTLLARMYKDPHLVSYSGDDLIQYIVRRLTPTECCRLQGFPDWWEDGVEGSDSARYKMWGNGMALPNMLYVMQGIKDTEDKRRGFGVWVRSSGRWG